MRTSPTNSSQIRRNKRDQIREFFAERLHQPLNSMALHIRFGTGVRGRISELNRDPDCPIKISNETKITPQGEVSHYTATPRRIQESLFGDLTPEARYPD